MKITNFSKDDYNVKLDLKLIRAEFKKYSFKKETEKNMINFLKKVVLPQLREGRRVLNLSNDVDNGEKLELTPRQAKRVKENLSKMKIIFVPEYGRQKKKGDYPIWLISYQFTVLEKKDKQEKTKRKTVDELYTKPFQKINEEAKKQAREYFEEVEESIRMFDDENFILSVSVKDFSIVKNMIIKEELKKIGKTRADFKI